MKNIFSHKFYGYFLSAVILLNGCAADFPIEETKNKPAPEHISKIDLSKLSDGSFSISTIYWAGSRGVAEEDWQAVFGGTVVEVKEERADPKDLKSRKFVNGAIKIEKIFLNLPDTDEIGIGSIVRSEDFDEMKKGDKIIFFVNGIIYEGGYCRVEVAGTNSKLGFKVKDWNDPIVSAVEKTAACEKVRNIWIEGHRKDFTAKQHDCYEERNKLVLDDPQISGIWKQNDPQGFQRLIEFRQYENSPKNNQN